MSDGLKNTLTILVLLTVLGVAGYYAYSHMDKKESEKAGDVYDYRKDKALIQTVRTALSMEAVMTRLTSGGKDGVTPEVKYGIDTVQRVGPGLIEVQYRLFIQSTHETVQKHGRKRFRRKPDGTWAAVRKK